MSHIETDVAILGGGMAGLTLARQLKRRDPALSIHVLEHRAFPAPEATYKVGESTVEIAAHYLAEELDLKAHLEDAQLPKFGLRLFCRGEQPIADDLARYDEIGASQVLPVPTYQLDRGRFETALAATCAADGIRVDDGTTIRDITTGRGRQTVTTKDRTYQSRYVIDASGRRALLRRKLNLERDARHSNQAIWFRVEGAVDVDALGSGQEWRERCHGTPRRLSTNHFTGPGYWLWLIPLASNTTSVGVVFDPKWVDPTRLANIDDLYQWLAAEHPLIHADIAGREVLDFHRMDRYAVGCRNTFSSEGWMITGDAGNFSDPFYSPGGDFIAIANTFITELITTGAKPDQVAQYQSDFNAFFASTIGLYKGLYGGFGDRDFMVAKTVWDYAYYWGVLSKLFFSNKLTDTKFMSELRSDLQSAFAMNASMQRSLRAVAREGRRVGGEQRFFDHREISLFHAWKQDLLDGEASEAGATVRANIGKLSAVKTAALSVLERRSSGLPSLSLSELNATLPAA